jgi:hypothetical protein
LEHINTDTDGLQKDRLFFYKSDLLEIVGLKSLSTLKKYITPLIDMGHIQWQFKITSSKKKMVTRREVKIIKHYLETGEMPVKAGN